MSWIDEAEKRLDSQEKEKASKEINKIQTLEENDKSFALFTDELEKLILRVNNLPYNDRKPCLELGSTKLTDEKTYEIFGSAYIYKNNLIAFFTGTKFKLLCWRRIQFKISDEPNTLKVHVSEIFSEKINGQPRTRKENKEKYKLKINGFNEKLILLTIDWLTFKCNEKELKRKLPYATPNKTHY